MRTGWVVYRGVHSAADLIGLHNILLLLLLRMSSITQHWLFINRVPKCVCFLFGFFFWLFLYLWSFNAHLNDCIMQNCIYVFCIHFYDALLLYCSRSIYNCVFYVLNCCIACIVRDVLTWIQVLVTFHVDYYRAPLCVRAVFAVDRCPSVRPSVTFVDCIQTAEDIVKLLSWPGSPVILVFDT